MTVEQGQRQSKVSSLLRKVEKRSGDLEQIENRLSKIERHLIGQEPQDAREIPEVSRSSQSLFDVLLDAVDENLATLSRIDQTLTHLESEFGDVFDQISSDGKIRSPDPRTLQKMDELNRGE